jgi:hypothetical protein
MEAQMGRSMNMLMIVGALLAIIGIAGLAVPVFTTPQTSEVARIGDLKIESRENTTHAIPPLVSGGVLVLGLVLLGGGLYRRQ